MVATHANNRGIASGLVSKSCKWQCMAILACATDSAFRYAIRSECQNHGFRF